MSLDRDDVEQAIEIACGARIGDGARAMTAKRTASQHHMDVLRQGILRFLAELPDDATVHEIKGALDES